MTESIETLEKYIELFVLLHQEYIQVFINSKILSKCDKRESLFFMGWKLLMHLFKRTRQMQRKMKDTYSIMQRGNSIFIEYVEQAIDAETDTVVDFGNLFGFIHRKIFDDLPVIQLEESNQIPEVFVIRMVKIAETIFIWNNETFKVEDRQNICNHFLQSYIVLLCSDKLIYYCDALDFLLEKTQPQNGFGVDDYSSFLTDFYLFVSRKKNHSITESDINNLFLNKYYSQIDAFDEMLSKEKNKGKFLKWFLSYT